MIANNAVATRAELHKAIAGWEAVLERANKPILLPESETIYFFDTGLGEVFKPIESTTA